MKQTNYHLFDFMDFDPSLHRDEALWKAYAPTNVAEREGDIVVTIPYQQQKRQEDMAPDTEAAHNAMTLSYVPMSLESSAFLQRWKILSQHPCWRETMMRCYRCHQK